VLKLEAGNDDEQAGVGASRGGTIFGDALLCLTIGDLRTLGQGANGEAEFSAGVGEGAAMEDEQGVCGKHNEVSEDAVGCTKPASVCEVFFRTASSAATKRSSIVLTAMLEVVALFKVSF